jgi:hypothetical protein
MMPAARRELWGGARQHPRFNNCGEGPALPSSHLIPARGAETDRLDLVGPPGRRCGNFFFEQIVGRGFEATMELGRSGDR